MLVYQKNMFDMFDCYYCIVILSLENFGKMLRKVHFCSDSFTILGLWVLGLAASNINASQLQTYESKTLFLMTCLQYYCIPGLAGTR